MNRETAIRTGLDLMTEEFGIDASAVIPRFVHILYDSDNGMIDDEEIYAGSEEEEIDIQYMAEGAIMLRSCLSKTLSELGLFIGNANNRAKKTDDGNTPEDNQVSLFKASKKGILRSLKNIDMAIEEAEMEAELRADTKEEERKSPSKLGIADEWIEDNEDGTFDRYAIAASREGKGILLKLTLVEDEDGYIDVAYMRAD